MSFTEALRDENRDAWDRAVSHRFVHEIGSGNVADPVMAQYLVQDYRFVDGFLAVVGCAITTSDNLDARMRFSRLAGEVANEEDTYFRRSFDALGVAERVRSETPDGPATTGFNDLFQEAAHGGDYAAALAVLVVAEWLYADWAATVSARRPERFVHAEWIALHHNEPFHERVAFLRSELDRVGPARADVVRSFFSRACRLEGDFFDDCYRTPFPVSAR